MAAAARDALRNNLERKRSQHTGAYVSRGWTIRFSIFASGAHKRTTDDEVAPSNPADEVAANTVVITSGCVAMVHAAATARPSMTQREDAPPPVHGSLHVLGRVGMSPSPLPLTPHARGSHSSHACALSFSDDSHHGVGVTILVAVA